MSEKLRHVDGFLFIGDPHVSSAKPGRRKDADFAATILNKIEHAIGIANDRKLLPVFLGDMFDRPKENDETIKTRLFRILRQAWTCPIILVGNHDRRNAVLSDGDTLAVFRESGVAQVIAHSGPIEEFSFGSQKRRVALGGTPHGQPIPKDVSDCFPEAESRVWITHHDIAFEGAYPGSQEPHAIKGCALVVNGHMHLLKKVRTISFADDETSWFNPGNITRQAVDAIDHRPAVWELSADSEIISHTLPHERNIFDLTGKLVEAVSPGELRAARAQEEGSEFIDLLSTETSVEMARSDDGAMLLEEIREKFEQERTNEDVRAAVMELFQKAVFAENS